MSYNCHPGRVLVGRQTSEFGPLMGSMVVVGEELVQETGEIRWCLPRLAGQPSLEGFDKALGDAVALRAMDRQGDTDKAAGAGQFGEAGPRKLGAPIGDQ